MAKDPENFEHLRRGRRRHRRPRPGSRRHRRPRRRSGRHRRPRRRGRRHGRPRRGRGRHRHPRPPRSANRPAPQVQAGCGGQPRRCHCHSGSTTSSVPLAAAGSPARSMSMSACAVASAAVAAASTVSHACVAAVTAAGAAGLGEDPRPGRIAGRLAQVHAADAGRAPGHAPAVRPRRSPRPRCTTRCGTRSRMSAASSTGSGRPVITARSGSRRASFAVRTSGATRCTARATPAALLAPTSAAPRPAGVTSAASAVAGVQAAHPGDPGRGEERRDAGTHPAGAVDPGERRPPPGQHRRAAVAVPVGQRGARQLGADSRAQVLGEGGAQAGREVVEHARRGQQLDHPVHRLLADAVRPGRPHHLGGVPRPVEQAHDGRRLAQPGQRAGTARVDADLERVLVPPERPKSHLQCRSHAPSVTPATDIPAAGGRPTGQVDDRACLCVSTALGTHCQRSVMARLGWDHATRSE